MKKKQAKQSDIRDMLEDRSRRHKEVRQQDRNRSEQKESSRNRIVTEQVVEDTSIQTTIIAISV
eukprot:1028217-Ditylum_brightwellii.AAC.1